MSNELTRDYFADLTATAARAERRAARSRPAATSPLAQQLATLFDSMPTAMRSRPWSIVELIPRLVGKYRARPHPQNVGLALRELGWRRTRNWRRGFDGARLWLPPPEPSTQLPDQP